MEEQTDGEAVDAGYAVGSIDGVGEGYGFRKIRRELGVKAFGVNAIVIPAGYDTGRHYHDEQEELYLVHRGRIEIRFGDGSSHVLEEGGLARVDPATERAIKNVAMADAVYVVIGAKDGYVGRDGRVPEDENVAARPGVFGVGLVRCGRGQRHEQRRQ